MKSSVRVAHVPFLLLRNLTGEDMCSITLPASLKLSPETGKQTTAVVPRGQTMQKLVNLFETYGTRVRVRVDPQTELQARFTAQRWS